MTDDDDDDDVVVALRWRQLRSAARPMHSIRVFGAMLRVDRDRVALLFGQSRDGREVLRAVDFDVDRATWSDWPLRLDADDDDEGQSAARSVPCARWCQASCVVGTGTVFLFGGSNWWRTTYRDAWLLHLSDRSWRRLPLADVLEPSRSPVARQCAAAVAIDATHVVLMGGVTRARGMSRMLNDFWLVDVAAAADSADVDRVWSLRSVSGDFVVPRESHSMLFDRARDRLVLFAGSTLRAALHPDWEQFVKCSEENGDHLLNDVVLVDLVTWSARVIDADVAAIPPRQGHAAAIVDDLLIVCGGEVSISRERINDVHVFDLVRERWIRRVQVGGRPPMPWSFAAACQFDDSLLLTNGFSDEDQCVYSLARSAPPSLFELCSLAVTRQLLREPHHPLLRPLLQQSPHAWSARVRQLHRTRAVPFGRRVPAADMYFAEMAALFSEIVDHLHRDVDESRPEVMQHWRDTANPERLASLLSLDLAEYGDDAELVHALRGCAQFALAHYESLFARPDDDDADTSNLNEHSGTWRTTAELEGTLEWRAELDELLLANRQ